MGSRSRRYLTVVGALLLLAVALTGCGEIRVVDATPSVPPADLRDAASPFAPEGVEHNLAVVAIEFDPPLDLRRLLQQRQPVTLLVAIENRGTQTEYAVIVEAQLTTPHDPDLLLVRGASTPRIAPGEIQVVRFPPLSAIPLFDAYRLEVSIASPDGETYLDDNRRAFDIQIRQQPGKP